MMWRQCTKRLLALFSGLVMVWLLAPVNIGAQEVAQISAGGARKFDEFTRVGGCDHSARLDNFAIQLQQAPEMTGYIIAYGPEGEGSGTGNFRLQVSKDYLVNSRGIEPDRIKTIYGGRYKDLEESVSELWIAPPGAEAPETVKYENKASEFKGKFIEYPARDGLILGAGEEGTGPPIGDVSFANFADMLRLQPKTYGYIVVYEGDESVPGAWGSISTRVAESLHSHYGIASNRTKIIFGGYDRKAKFQLWILPDDAPPPVEEVKKERKLQKTIQLGTFSQFELSHDNGAISVFKEFAEMLSKDEDLKVCIIIRPEDIAVSEPSADEAANEAAAVEEVAEEVVTDEVPDEVASDETPEVDLFQVVEQWKKDLAKQYRIPENRMIVMIAQPHDDFAGGQIETWVVPPDAPLPELYPSLEEEIPEETAEAEKENQPQF